MRLIPTEHQIQCAVIRWWDLRCRTFGIPRFALFAIPNAGAGAQKGQAGKMKAEGVRKGIPDLFLAVPRQNAGGLFIEMKSRKGQIRMEQREVMDSFAALGYRVAVARSVTEAIAAICEYLGAEYRR